MYDASVHNKYYNNNSVLAVEANCMCTCTILRTPYPYSWIRPPRSVLVQDVAATLDVIGNFPVQTWPKCRLSLYAKYIT